MDLSGSMAHRKLLATGSGSQRQSRTFEFSDFLAQDRMGKRVMNRLAKIALTVLAGTAFSSAFADGPLEEWEMTTTIHGGSMGMQGGPMGMPSGQKMIVCQKKMDKAQGAPPPPQSNCSYTNMGKSGDRGSFTMECKGTPPNIPPSTIKGEGKVTGDTMEGTMVITTAGHEISMDYSGKRLGSCDKEGARSAGGPAFPGMDMQSMMDSRKPPSQRDGSTGQGAAGGDRAPQGPSHDAPASAPRDSGQDGRKEEPKDVAGKAVDAAKKAIGGFLPF
jgi:hypothetical protein